MDTALGEIAILENRNAWFSTDSLSTCYSKLTYKLLPCATNALHQPPTVHRPSLASLPAVSVATVVR